MRFLSSSGVQGPVLRVGSRQLTHLSLHCTGVRCGTELATTDQFLQPYSLTALVRSWRGGGEERGMEEGRREEGGSREGKVEKRGKRRFSSNRRILIITAGQRPTVETSTGINPAFW